MKDRFLIDAMLVLSLISLHILLFAILIYQYNTNGDWLFTTICLVIAIFLDLAFYLQNKNEK